MFYEKGLYIDGPHDGLQGVVEDLPLLYAYFSRFPCVLLVNYVFIRLVKYFGTLRNTSIGAQAGHAILSYFLWKAFNRFFISGGFFAVLDVPYAWINPTGQFFICSSLPLVFCVILRIQSRWIR